MDDSDDELLQHLIRDEVMSWKEKGVNIVYRHRFIRTGYKAGNLKSAMACDYVKDYEFVTIFDADFQPNPDFLKLTVPHFKVYIIIQSIPSIQFNKNVLCNVMSFVSISGKTRPRTSAGAVDILKQG